MRNNVEEHRQRMAEENTEFKKAQGEADSNFMFFLERTAATQRPHVPSKSRI